jgi:hypothetical protein
VAVSLLQPPDRVDTVGDRQHRCYECTGALLQFPHRVDTIRDRQPHCVDLAESPRQLPVGYSAWFPVELYSPKIPSSGKQFPLRWDTYWRAH